MWQEKQSSPDDIDTIVNEFDRQWQLENSPDLSSYLNRVGSTATSQRLAFELVAVELEYRWKNAHKPGASADLPWKIEKYIEVYPQLSDGNDPPTELICEEYRVRQRWGDKPGHAEYLERFPNASPTLVRNLQRVDAELLHDSISMHDTDSRGTRTALLGEQLECDIELEQQGKFTPRDFGKYRLLKVLGQGAMGVVYLAEDCELHRKVALKTPRMENATSERTARFLNEARTSAALRHPNLCPVYDAGQVDGQYYITMAYIEGLTLSQLIAKRGQLPTVEVIRLTAKIAEAVHSAHQSGFIHRDLKSSNIMIDKQGEPIVMDFGLARPIVGDANPRLTHSGHVVGSPAYMAPEQVEADNAQIGPATDVYALGVILFELLTGSLPFVGSVGAVLAQISRDQPPSPTSLNNAIPRPLEKLCLQMLSKDPARRPCSIEQVARELKDIGDRLDTDRKAQETTKADSGSVYHRVVIVSVVGIALLGLFLAFAPLIFRVQTKYGDVLIKSFDPNIEVTIKRNGTEVKDFAFIKGPVSTRVRTGSIEVIIKGAKANGVRIRNGQFELTEDKKVVVEILGPEHASRDSKGKKSVAPNTGKPTTGKPSTNKPHPARPVQSSPFDSLRREDISKYELRVAGDGDPAKAPKELVAVLGDSRLMHHRAARAVDFHPDGKTFVSVGHDFAIRFWNTETGEQTFSLDVLRSHEDYVLRSVAIDPKGNKFAAGGNGGLLKIWDFHTKKEELSITGLAGSVANLRWTPDSRRLVGAVLGDGGNPSHVVIWDAKSGREIATLKSSFEADQAKQYIHSLYLDVSPDGKQIVTGYTSFSREIPPQVTLWDAASGQRIAELTHDEKKGLMRSVAWSADGNNIAVGLDVPEKILLWDTQKGGKAIAMSVGAWSSGRSLAWSPDGKFLVAADRGKVVLYDTQKWIPVKRLDCPREHSWYPDLKFSHDGQFLAGAGWGGAVALWNVDSGKEAIAVQGHCAAVTGVEVDSAGKQIATCSLDFTVRLWNSTTAQQSALFVGNVGFHAIGFGPDDNQLVGAGADEIMAWNLISKQTRSRIRERPGFARDVAFSPSGDFLAVSFVHPEKIVVFDSKGQEVYRKSVGVPYHPPRLAFDPQGKTLAVGSNEILLLRPESGEMMRRIAVPGKVGTLDFSPNGERLLVAGDFAGILQYDVHTGEKLSRLSGEESRCLAAHFSADGTRIVSLHPGRRLHLWDTAVGEKVLSVRLNREAGGYSNVEPFNRIALAPDGRHVLVANNNGTVYVLRLQTTTGPAASKRVPDIRSEKIDTTAHDSYVMALASGGEGRYIASGSNDHTVILWDAITRSKKYTFNLEAKVFRCAIDAEGRWLLAGDESGVVTVWDIASGKQLHSLQAHTGQVKGLAFLKDGAHFISAGTKDLDAKVFETEKGTVLRQFRLPSQSNICLAYHAPTQQIAVGSREGIVAVLDAETGATIWVEKQGAKMNKLVFNRQGKLLVAGRWDGSIDVFDADSGNKRISKKSKNNVTAIAFTSDGKQILSGTFDHSVLEVRDASSGELVESLPAVAPVVSLVLCSDGTIVAGHARGQLSWWTVQ